ncbi:MAG: ribosome-associated protein [Hyphomicrobiaceae bacterium]|jgi:ribosome-associated protein
MSEDDLIAGSGRVRVAAEELQWSFARSSGPGGQNVNKRETKAVLRWAPGYCQKMPADVLRRLIALSGNKMTTEGELVISSDVHRERERNIEECRKRLAELLRRAAIVPRTRRATKPTAGAKKRRLTAKKVRAGIKTKRSRVSRDDE